jgi:3'-phosphoadenosine 5'-phosphosulfate sulfotransferase (PAPS reductase)/FAD synthetase
MKKNTTQNGKKGGLLDGPSHDNGGIPVVVKSTNEPIEVEGGEIIINKEASKKHCKLLSKINQSAGNGIEIPCDCEDCSKDEQMKLGGKTNITLEREKIYQKWKGLINMSYSELENFYNSDEGKQAGLSSDEAKEKGISSGRESARWILKMLETDKDNWTPLMWTWANKQISFISRMSGVKGPLFNGTKKTRKHLALLIWGHNPQKAKRGIKTQSKGNSIVKTKNGGSTGQALDEWNAKFNNFRNGPGFTNTITELNEKDIDYTGWTDLDIFSWSEKQNTQAKKGKFIFPINKKKTTQPNLAPEITFEETIIEIEQKYMEGADRILTMADGQEKVTQATRNALIDWVLEPKNNTKVIIAFSGGKDSVAMVLHAFNLGIKKEQIELWHHDIDGHGEELFDWACTPSYCQAIADHFGLPLLFSYRNGGIAREIQRNNETSQDVYFQREAKGDYYVAKSVQEDKWKTTKNMFPAIKTKLSERWCSASAKIQVMSKAITNNPKFDKGNFVIMTGERRAESTGRSHYNEIEPYANMSQNRRAITWRPIIDFSEKEVWELMKTNKIQPHPCYMLGWGRCSCQLCIFGDGATWKSIQEINPAKVERIAELEKQNAERGSEIATLHAKNKQPIGIKEWIETRKEPKERDETQPPNAKGVYPYKKYPKGHVQPLSKSFIKSENKDKWKDQAQGKFTMPIIVQGEWVQPQGAFSKKQCGAT